MRSRAPLAALLLTMTLVIGSLAVAQRPPPPPEVEATPLAVLDRGSCDPPFHGSNCPPPPGPPQCRTRLTAESRDHSVRVEIIEDGHPLDLVALHLVIHDGPRAYVWRELGHSGVGCGTFDMYATSFSVDTVRVANVMLGPRPEVIAIATGSRGRQLILCTTDGASPSCVRGDISETPRFRRPDLVISGMQRFRVRLPGETRVP